MLEKLFSMKKIIFIMAIVLGLFATNESQAQWRLNAGVDLLKTPFFEPFPAIQVGMEMNYFIVNRVAFTGGFEYWQKPDLFGASVGARFYPISPVFIRMRGILAAESDFAIGFGYAIKLNRDWRLELMSDYFAVNQDFAIRFGIGYSL